MSRLIIIGNGFDRAHGLYTLYDAFLEFIEMYEPKFYEAISKYISDEYLWSNFEMALGKLNGLAIQRENSSYYLDYADDNWMDSANHEFQYMIQKDLTFATDIPYYFSEWIRTIDTNVRRVVSSDTINRQCIFLNFNYTDTLERVYGIPEDRILYIHGKALRNDKLVVGHHDCSKFQEDDIPAFNAPEEQGRYMYVEEEDFRITEAREIIKDYFRETYKDTESIIEKNWQFFDSLVDIDEVFILGHSLSDIDMDYFDEVWKCVSPECRWYISYYSSDDLKRIRWFERYFNLQVQRVRIEKL